MSDRLRNVDSIERDYARREIYELQDSYSQLLDNQYFHKIIICLDYPSIPKNKKMSQKKNKQQIYKYFTSQHKCSKNFFKNIIQDDIDKPSGLWYSCGVDWYNYSYRNLEERISNRIVYSFDVDYSNMLKISNEKQLLKFHNQYLIPRSDYFRINWKLVASKYSGIEICPYFRKYMFSFPKEDNNSIINNWYYLWSAASGCIWDPKVIKNIVYGGKLPFFDTINKTTPKIKSKNLTKFLLIITKILRDKSSKQKNNLLVNQLK